MVAYIVLMLALLLVARQPAPAQSLELDEAQILPGVWAGRAVWGDYDNDGDPDLVLVGEEVDQAGACVPVARVFRNEGGLLARDLSQQLLGVYFGDAGWADYDNDGDLDLAVVGWDGEGDQSLRVYQNEMGGPLTWDQDQADLTGVRYAHLAWGDYDNDGDPDLLVTGMMELGNSLSRLYNNEDGQLGLDQPNSAALVNVHGGEAAWGDFDNDGDLDLVVSGENVSEVGGQGVVTEFYLNEPTGTLSQDQGLVLRNQVKGGSVAWGDYDNDGNIDLAVSGRDRNWNGVLEVYRNRPLGVLVRDDRFTLPVTQRVVGSLAWIDYDNDGSLDLAASGRSMLSDYQAFVFRSQAGLLTALTAESALVGLAGGNTAWADYNGDGRLDLINTGVDQQGGRRTQLYANLGTPLANAPPSPPAQLNTVQVTSRRALFSWAPGSDLESENLAYNIRVGSEPGGNDILTGALGTEPANTGFKTSRFLESELAPDTYYWSVQAVDGAGQVSAWSQEELLPIQQFVSSEQRLTALREAALAWGDFDNDGDLDLVAAGRNRSGDAQTLFYHNRAGDLAVDSGAELGSSTNGDAAWGDFDNDGDLDLVLIGDDTFGNPQSLLYSTEEDDGQFSLVPTGGFPKLARSVARWGDFDNDGDLDLVHLGHEVTGQQQSFTRIYVNDGAGGFADGEAGLEGVNNGEAAWADADGDGDLDLAVNGLNAQEVPQFSYYRNDDGRLADAGLDLPGLHSSDLAWGDFDRDGDVDLVAGGLTEAGGLRTRIFENAGGGQLSERLGDPFPGIQGGDLAWGDYDNDQDLDLVIVGNDGRQALFQVYENDNGAFVQDSLKVLQPVDFSAVSLADIEGDGDLDLISAGRSLLGLPSAQVNDNLEGQFHPNQPPLAPAGPVATDDGDGVLLSWNEGTDDGGPPPASLTYHVRVGTETEGDQVVSGALPLGPGNAGHNPFMSIEGLASGTYFWSVRTVDHSAVPSSWSPSQSFIIDTVAPQVDTLVFNRQQAGIGQTVSLVLSFTDLHAGVDAAVAPEVTASIGDQIYPFKALQFTGGSWSGELTIEADMASGSAAVAVSGVVDDKGNEMVPFQEADAFAVDTELPAVTVRSPAAGAVGVDLGTRAVNIGFSEALDAAGITADNFRLVLDGENVELLAPPALDDATNSVQMLPDGGLEPGSQYVVEVSAAIQDLAGNRPDNVLTWSFSTQVPQLLETRPAAGAEQVTIVEDRIAAVFDVPLLLDQLDAASVQVLRQGAAETLSGDPQFDAATLTLSVAPEGGLKAGSGYEVVVAGRVAGPLRVREEGDFRWQFQTAVPQISSQSPAPGDEGVSTADPTIRVVFDAAVDQAALGREAAVQVLQSGAPVAISPPEYIAGTQTVSFEVADGLRAGTRYQVVLADAVGGPLREDAYQWNFSTAVPQVVGVTPDSSALAEDIGLPEAQIEFSVPIDEGQRSAANFALLENGAPVALRPGDPIDRGAGVYGLAPADNWRVGSTYSVQIAPGVTGPLGTDQLIAWQFQTRVPQISSRTPEPGDAAVAAGTSRIEVAFDAAVDEEALGREAAVQVLQSGAPVVISPPEYIAGTQTVSFEVADGLRAGASYQVVLADAVGGPLREDAYQWNFSTAVPQVVGVTPDSSALAEDIGLPEAQIEFSVPIDEGQRSAANFALLENGAPVALRPGDSIDRGAGVYGLAPADNWRVGSTYSVQIAPGVTGPLGTDQLIAWQFQTRVPQISSQSPAPGAEGVATADPTIRVVFDAAVDEEALGREAAVQVLQSGAPVAISPPEYIAGTQTVSFEVADGLRAGTSYQVVLADAVGGPLREDAYQWNFSTAVPQVVGVTPDSSALAEDIGLPEAQIEFSVPIDEGQRSAANFALLENGAPVALRPGDPIDRGAGVYGLAPADNWRVGSTYSVQIAPGVTGPLGTDQLIAWQFQTRVPQISSRTPEPGDAAVAAGTSRIEVAFDAAVDEEALGREAAVQVLAEGRPVAFDEPAYNRNSYTVTIAPAEGLKAGTNYQVILANALGGPLLQDDFIWNFSTQVPGLVGTLPEDGDRTVDIGLPEAQVEFSVPIDEGQRNAANFALLQDGEAVALREGDPVDLGAGVYGLAPASSWRVGSTYSVQIAPGVTGPLGTDQPIAWQFQTAVPQISSQSPAPGAEGVSTADPTIRVVFDAAVDQAALDQEGNVVLLAEGQSVPISDPAYNAGTQTLSFAPATGLRAGTRYRVSLSSALGGPLRQEAGDFVWNFSTRVPGLDRTQPAAGAEGVLVQAATISVFFSDRVASQNAADFQLLARDLADPEAQSELVAITTPSADSAGTQISFAPSQGLESFTEYEVQVGQQVLGPLAETGFSWIFRTAAQLANAERGGTVGNVAKSVELFFPPKALLNGGSGEVVIRPLDEDPDASAPAGATRVGTAYQLELASRGASLRKPLTLTMRYTAGELGARDAARLAIYRLGTPGWERLGGTPEADEGLVRTTVEQLATFALFEDLEATVGALQIADLDCQPRSFTPAGGNLREQTDISFTLTGPTDLNVQVYNASGRLERIIARDQPMAAGRHALSWDGRDEERRIVSRGLYIVVVRGGEVRREKVVAVVR